MTELSKSNMQNIENLSNQLSNNELKDLIANQITIDEDSNEAFAEKIYVRAKLLIMQ